MLFDPDERIPDPDERVPDPDERVPDPDEREPFCPYFLETEMQDGGFSRRPSEVVVNGPPGPAASRKWSRNGPFK